MGVETRKYIKEVKYFSPNGKNHLPNGHPIQKGGFVKECKDNSAKFKTNNKQFFITRALKIVDSAHTNQYVLPEYKGGIIVFTSETNALEIDKTKLFTWFSKKIKSKGNTFFQKGKLTGIIDKLIKAKTRILMMTTKIIILLHFQLEISLLADILTIIKKYLMRNQYQLNLVVYPQKV